MILDLKLGGDLRFHLTYKGPFAETRARFYYMEVACALNYLHKLKIVHRDIKPDNILLDDKGHASVTDFNVACHYKDEKPMASKSGTARYMAPEVINGAGYLNEIDWWSLAVTTYEMFYGYPPFRARHKDELKKAILSDTVEFSKNVKYQISDTASKFITDSLVRPLSERLGSNETGGFEKIKLHEWFKDCDWNKVEKMEIPVPFLPDVERNAYHDPRYGLEEMFSGRNELSDKPVKTAGMVGGRRRSSALQSVSSTNNPASPNQTHGQNISMTGDSAVSNSLNIRPHVGVDRRTSNNPNAVAPIVPIASAIAIAGPVSPATVINSAANEQKKSFFSPRSSRKEEVEYISSQEELQLQLFETKYTVYDWTKPPSGSHPKIDINTEDKTAQDEEDTSIQMPISQKDENIEPAWNK
ncbi:hypothetical protein HK100_004430 [Physocladia obscura]|uniref:non-specific serine/threonine protein kinase n=1 Tax=Physocladia obscura TaxID=109957 RepID=A0AAD5T733_9FUNG|nr:hypothetical protein HK100_004430 [Physocladia obscura]